MTARLKATKVQAIALEISDGGQAVLVQDGPDWNGLRKFKCIAPPTCAGQSVVAARDPSNSPLGAMFGELFNLGDGESWVVVMASPDLASQLKRD